MTWTKLQCLNCKGTSVDWLIVAGDGTATLYYCTPCKESIKSRGVSKAG